MLSPASTIGPLNVGSRPLPQTTPLSLQRCARAQRAQQNRRSLLVKADQDQPKRTQNQLPTRRQTMATAFENLAPRIMGDLIFDFDLMPEQAAGVVGNLGAESGLSAVQEARPIC